MNFCVGAWKELSQNYRLQTTNTRGMKCKLKMSTLIGRLFSIVYLDNVSF